MCTGIMEHIEEAGIHSGDSACVLPPHSLPYKTVREIEKQTIKLAKALKVKGLMNVQFAVKKNKNTGEQDIYILEVNPRASRTVPFVAKATGVPVAMIAARLMAGERLSDFDDVLTGMNPDHTAVKAPVFPVFPLSLASAMACGPRVVLIMKSIWPLMMASRVSAR